jgi:hypothetical protein
MNSCSAILDDDERTMMGKREKSIRAVYLDSNDTIEFFPGGDGASYNDGLRMQAQMTLDVLEEFLGEDYDYGS